MPQPPRRMPTEDFRTKSVHNTGRLKFKTTKKRKWLFSTTMKTDIFLEEKMIGDVVDFDGNVLRENKEIYNWRPIDEKLAVKYLDEQVYIIVQEV